MVPANVRAGRRRVSAAEACLRLRCYVLLMWGGEGLRGFARVVGLKWQAVRCGPPAAEH